MILRLLMRLFHKKQREIKKLDIIDQLSKYRFRTPEDVEEILKYNRTVMTLWHWECPKSSQDIVKGMSLMLNILLDAHEAALETEKYDDPDKKMKIWNNYKAKEKQSLWDNINKLVRGSEAK